jgi:hypothetical protein
MAACIIAKMRDSWRGSTDPSGVERPAARDALPAVRFQSVTASALTGVRDTIV